MVEPPPPIVLPPPSPIRTRVVTLHVLDTGSVCMAPQEYKDMAHNMAEILRWVKEARHQLDFYAMPKGKAPAE